MLRRPLSVIEFSPAEEDELVGRIKDLLQKEETPSPTTSFDDNRKDTNNDDKGKHQRRPLRPTEEIPMELE